MLYVFVALIEETAKMIVPVVLPFLLLARHGRRLPSDGLVIGVTSGMGFAALAVLSLGWLFLALHRYRTFAEHSARAPREPLVI